MTHTIRKGLLAGVVVLVIAGLAFAWYRTRRVPPPEQQDEARLASREAASFPAADEDYFRDMDQNRGGPVALSPDEIRGRNTWIVWSAGNDRLWDTLSVTSGGALDFLKVVSSHPSQNYSRTNRWDYFGLVNEPCFTKPTGGNEARWGLWFDQRQADCPADPFENAAKYPGVQTGSRGQTLNGKAFETGAFYGYATGIVGLRLFPNPNFDEQAAKRWDAERYYTDRTYYEDKTLVRPYRVGMSCGFCHVGPNPVNPPADPNNPAWANLSSNVGAQYFTIARIFYQAADFEDFAFQIFHSSRPGSLDTSFVASDNINNPRTMNAMYLIGPRLLHAKRWGKETLAGGGLDNRQFSDFIKDGPLATLFASPAVWAPRVLKDGADSVGALGALNRVYFNIGTFSEEWTQHFLPLIGAQTQTPLRVEAARRNSAYFKATEAQTLDTAKFFLKTTDGHHLADAPGGTTYLTTDASVLTRGKEVFADTCARCHSTKLPAMVEALDPEGCNGKGYLDCWNRYWASTQTPEFKKQMREIVTAPDFLNDNYLSAEFRVPVTLLQTNACSPLATNAMSGNIWDNFSSQSYKELPSVGKMLWYHPYSGEARSFEMPAGGRGYTRPPSLVSLWSTAPFLLNNTVGRLEMSPSVEGRMRSFDDSIRKLLWPREREKDSLLGDKIPGLIDRVGDRAPEGHGTQQVYLKFSAGYLPEPLKRTLRTQQTLFPSLFSEDGLRIGPIPRGTPIGLLSNLRLVADDPSNQVEHDARVAALMVRILARLHKLGGNATDAEARDAFRDLVDPLLEMSKCPDFVVNRGHLFGTELADAEKRALIEFLKTF